MAVNDRRPSLSNQRSTVVGDLLSTLMIPILLLTTAPCTLSQGPLSNVDSFFIVADSFLSNLYQVNASSGATAQLQPFGVASEPIAIAYDPDDKLIYWTDEDLHTINRYSLVTNSSTVIYHDPSIIAWYRGLAIDVGRQTLYYADFNGGKLGELSTDGTGHRVLISDDYYYPYKTVIDVDNRILYWTETGRETAGVYRSSVISPAPEIVISGIGYPTALAIDFTAGVMYWADTYPSMIETAYLDGTGRRTLLTGTYEFYQAFALDGGILYYVSYSEYIQKLEIDTNSTSTITSPAHFQHLRDIIFVPGTDTTDDDSEFPYLIPVIAIAAVVFVVIIIGAIVCCIAAAWK